MFQERTPIEPLRLGHLGSPSGIYHGFSSIRNGGPINHFRIATAANNRPPAGTCLSDSRQTALFLLKLARSQEFSPGGSFDPISPQSDASKASSVWAVQDSGIKFDDVAVTFAGSSF